MAYDGSSITGDEICDYYYDIENNFMNPESPFGYFIYKIIGGGFDYIDGLINQFKIDMDLLNSNVGKTEIVDSLPSDVDIDTKKTYYIPVYDDEESYHFTKYEYVNDEWVESSHIGKIINTLDTFWGKSYQLQRIEISYLDENEVLQKRMMTDREYKIYLYLKNHPLMTKKDLTVAFTRCFSLSDDEDDVYLSVETGADLSFVDHVNYDNFTNPSLEKMNPDDTNALTDFINDSDYEVISDKKTPDSINMVNIPNQNLDQHFLDFLETFISIKGNVKINQGA